MCPAGCSRPFCYGCEEQYQPVEVKPFDWAALYEVLFGEE